MSFVVKKRDLTDPAQLQALVVEHADDLERGLTVLDSRLMLGQASIDIVGLDADGALVLIAVGVVADEEMLLKAVDAYSWCLEYPDAIHRLYPAVHFSAAHPPRVVFVVERMPDAFHRKIKQLGFAEVDCVEFRHLDVDGTPAVYFDSLARLRRAVAPTAAAPEQHGAPTAPVASGRPTSLKLQKLLGADRPVAGREPAPIVRMVHRTPPGAEPKPVASAPRTERVAAPQHDEPSTASWRPTVETPAPPGIRGAVTKPTRTASPARDRAPVVTVTEAVVGVPELLAQGVEAVEAMVEPFVVAERPTQNGRVDFTPMTVCDPEPEKARAAVIVHDTPPVAATFVRELVASAPVTPIPEPIVPTPVIADDAVTLVTTALEPEVTAAASSAPEPQPIVRKALELEPRGVIDATPDSYQLTIGLAEPNITEPEPAIAALSVDALPPIVSEPEPAVAELSVEPLQPNFADPEPVVAPLSVESLPPIVSEPEPAVAEPSVEPLQPSVADPEPVVAQLSVESLPPSVSDPESPVAELSVESLPPILSEPEPAVAELSVESLPPSVSDPESPVAELSVESLPPILSEPEPAVAELSVESLPPIVAEPEPVVAEPGAPSVEAIAPAAAPPPPSVFSRRSPEPARRTDMKVSFAGMAKDLLTQTHPTPQILPPVSIARPSVEDITRATLDDLVGATEKRETDDRSTAFAKPSGAFSKSPTQKRPLTIAPPQTEGQPIAGGPKLGTAPRRNGPSVTADSAPAGTQTEAAQPVPEGFEGLQFPNDGVLTRQWMEFLNQMAAGK